ncbi:MAG: flagellar basal body-associated FliL family protein [Reinekea sp.]
MADEELAADRQEEGKGKAGGKLKKILFIVLGVILISGLSVFTTWFMLKDKLSDPVDPDITDIPLGEPTMSADQGEAIYHALQPAFIVNYNTAGKSRYVQVELSVLTRDPTAVEVLIQHNPLIRNNLLEVFAKQDVNELVSAEGKQKLVDDLTLAIQDILVAEIGRPGIETVLFRSFVMQ